MVSMTTLVLSVGRVVTDGSVVDGTGAEVVDSGTDVLAG